MKRLILVLFSLMFILSVNILAEGNTESNDETEITEDNNHKEYHADGNEYETSIQEIYLIASADIKYSIVLPKYAPPSEGEDDKDSVEDIDLSNPYTFKVKEGENGTIDVEVYKNGVLVEYDEGSSDGTYYMEIDSSKTTFTSNDIEDEYKAKTTITISHDELPSGVWSSKLPISISLSKEGD